MAEWNLEDPFWLDTSDSKFGKMVELGSIVGVEFIENLNSIHFYSKFKGSGDKFYEAVYAKAAKINHRLADELDTYICR